LSNKNKRNRDQISTGVAESDAAEDQPSLKKQKTSADAFESSSFQQPDVSPTPPTVPKVSYLFGLSFQNKTKQNKTN